MGKSKDMWMDEVEDVQERATLGPNHYRGLSQEDAAKRLVRLGFDQHEAQTMIAEILS